jgi:hypothetical protein
VATATYKVLNQVSPAVTTETTLYTVPAGTQSIVSTLTLSNITHLATPGPITVTVRVRPAGIAAANKHIVVPAVSIPANQAYTLTLGISLATTDVVSVQSSVANGLAASAFGTEIA